MLGIIKKFFGTKSNRDLKEILPLVAKIHQAYEKIKLLSNDDLRAMTNQFRERIQAFIGQEDEQIATLKARIEAEPDMDVHEREKLYQQIDSLKKNVLEKTEQILLEILPEAFSVMKETGRRFKENEWVEVTATERDRDLSVKRDNIVIEGDKARYRNSWMAGGNIIKWDMMHYDVQLIGGIVLHKGKIAEMATGEGKTLVATLPVYLNALPGKGVHLVTVNDYLSKRDTACMGMLFELHGLKVDCIKKHQNKSNNRSDHYNADIT